MRIADPIVHFWSFVARCGAASTDCWLWTGTTTKHGGYGIIKWNGKRNQRVSRIAWELAHGKPLGQWRARHTCDETRCCNPAHIVRGTQRQNVRDRERRQRTAVGERCARARLTEDQVRFIRTQCAAGVAQATMAARFGTSRPAISFIVNRQTWKHI